MASLFGCGPGCDVLDAWGNVYPFGGAPGVTVTAYFKGWDAVRDLVLTSDVLDGDDRVSGYVVDTHGRLHPFFSATDGDGDGVLPWLFFLVRRRRRETR